MDLPRGSARDRAREAAAGDANLAAQDSVSSLSGLALLMFNRNDSEGVRRNIRSLQPVVREVLVVDSSDPEVFRRLREELEAPGVRFLRVLPIGCTEPLRRWAEDHVESEWILSVDSDEEVSAPFLPELATLRSADAYQLLREELGIGAYSFQLRLFRRGAVSYKGTIHEAPTVRGRVVALPPPAQLLHHADYPNYLAGVRRRDYPTLEAFERPFTGRHLREEFPGRFTRLFLGSGDRMISPIQMGCLLATHRLRRYNPYNPLRGNLLTGKYLAAYLRARFQWFRSLSDAERDAAIRVAGEIADAGGVIRYLGFDTPGYLEHLTDTFPWGLRETGVLRELFLHRHRDGAPMTDWLEPRAYGVPAT